MIKQQWINPTLSMFATLLMCGILSVCQHSKASENRHEYTSHSKNHVVSIRNNNGERTYRVNDKSFTFDELSPEHQKKILKLEKNLELLEVEIEKSTEGMEEFSEQIERVAERMESEAEKLEQKMESIEFNSSDLAEMSKKLAAASSVLEVKMSKLEREMREIEVRMPDIDHEAIRNIEIEAKKYEELLVQIADEI
jgi:chromosome segregation ATPase